MRRKHRILLPYISFEPVEINIPSLLHIVDEGIHTLCNGANTCFLWR
jgi:hypothetical protein